MIKRKIFEIIQPDCGNSSMSRAFDLLITGLILVSVVAVFAGTFELSAGTSHIFEMIEKIASVIFTIEYALRIVTADLLHPELSPWKSRVKYVVSPMAAIDLVAILPFWLPMILPGSLLGMRALRLVRLLRIFKLNRYFDAMRAIGAVIVEKKRELVGSMFFVILLMLVTSLLMYSVEHDAQPEAFRNAFSGLWWAVATVTTVGYGDIYPITPLGRLLGALIAFSGIAAVAVPTGIITAGLSSAIERTKEPEKECKEDACRHDKVEELCRALSENKEMLEDILEIVSMRQDKGGRGSATESPRKTPEKEG
ncbi:MAG: ion transporter [Kiritimatiellae bacterium]|nr:ion transporter [Kiritimatiellia bacterium]